MGAVNSTFRLPLGALLPAGIFALPARSCLSIHCMGNYRRSKNDHLSWIMLSFLGMCCPVLYIVSTHPFPPWLATCTCGVWQIGFLCWEKGPLGMTGGRQNLTPSFSPMQSRDAFPPLHTVGNHMHRVELEEKLWEQGLWHYSWVSKSYWNLPVTFPLGPWSGEWQKHHFHPISHTLNMLSPLAPRALCD